MADINNTPMAALRRLLQAVLIGDSDLEAFCLDYFPAVSRRFSSGMDRTQKLSVLLAAEDAQEIVGRLAEAEPTRFARNKALLQSEPAVAATVEPRAESGPATKTPRSSLRAYSREDLFDLLCGVPASQFEIVVFRLNLRSAILAPKTTPQSERALQIIELLESEGAMGLARLTAAIAKTAPQLLK